MVQILQIISIILLAFIGGQIADPIGKICVDRTEVYKKMKVFDAACKTQIKIFDESSGPKESKYEQFEAAWSKISTLTKSFIQDSFPDRCFDGKKKFRDMVFGVLLSFIQTKSEISEKEYLSYTDPKIIKKIAENSAELDACFENSRNLTEISPEEIEINFCSYNMDKALLCSQTLFKHDKDSIIGLIAFTNYFVKEFDCDANQRISIKDSMVLEFYYNIVKRKEKKTRQTFFQGYQIAAKDFTNYD